jgi:hypothetical protein
VSRALPAKSAENSGKRLSQSENGQNAELSTENGHFLPTSAETLGERAGLKIVKCGVLHNGSARLPEE